MAKAPRIRRKRKRRAPSVRRNASAAAQVQQKGEQRESSIMIGGAHDPAEKAADKMAAQVLSGGPVATSGAGGGNAAIHRKCAECEAEDKGVKRSTNAPTVAPGTASAPASKSASKAINTLGSGRPLSKSERGFFEPRFGRDFGDVRVHEGGQADRAARGIGAEAFTKGNDVAFANGGKTQDVMAHELAHVAQDSNNTKRKTLRRYTIAENDHPTDATYKKVPAAHKARIKKAMDLVGNVIENADCKNFFKDKCNADAADAVHRSKIAWEKATVYHLNDRTPRTGESIARANDASERSIAYNLKRYDSGVWSLGNTFVHELFHTCILGAIPNEHTVAEMAAEACEFYTPEIKNLLPDTGAVGDTIAVDGRDLGPQADADHKLFLNGTEIPTTKWEIDPGYSSNTVEFDIPAGAKSGKVHIENHNVKSNSKRLKVT